MDNLQHMLAVQTQVPMPQLLTIVFSYYFLLVTFKSSYVFSVPVTPPSTVIFWPSASISLQPISLPLSKHTVFEEYVIVTSVPLIFGCLYVDVFTPTLIVLLASSVSLTVPVILKVRSLMVSDVTLYVPPTLVPFTTTSWPMRTLPIPVFASFLFTYR